MSNEEAPPQDPNNVEDEEDDIIKVDDESPAEFVAQPSHQIHIPKAEHSGAAGNNLIAPALEERSYQALFIQLLEKEMSLKIEQLSPGEYLAAILMYFIQNNPVEGRFAVLRALERHNTIAPFVSMIDVSTALCDENLSLALLQLNQFNADQSFEPYLTELKNRLMARRLKQILRAYSVISLPIFAKSLGHQEPNKTIEEILAQLNWTVDEKGFVHPADTEAFRNLIGIAQKAEFGPEILPKNAYEGSEKKEAFSAEALQQLVTLSEFLDRPLTL